jgi:hypothetical protein
MLLLTICFTDNPLELILPGTTAFGTLVTSGVLQLRLLGDNTLVEVFADSL